MPNYEELYNDARNKYYQAIENKNNMQRASSELTSQRNSLINEINQKQSQLRSVKYKVLLLQNAENYCASILGNEVKTMKASIQATSDEYKKIITSDKGIADIQAVYSGDIRSTENDLNSVHGQLKSKRKNMENEAERLQKSINQCSSELNSVSSRLNNTTMNTWAAQSQVNGYYVQMKAYQKLWENSH